MTELLQSYASFFLKEVRVLNCLMSLGKLFHNNYGCILSDSPFSIWLQSVAQVQRNKR